MAAKDHPRVIVIGGGLAGLAATVRIAEAGVPVDLLSLVPVKRSHSVCAQGGINACTEPVRQEGFTEWNHFDETLYGGDFLNHQPPVYEMAHSAPRIIHLLDRMGVPFNRTPEGYLDRRYFGGSLFRRTHFAGASTGQQLLYGLDEQTRRYEATGLVNKYEFWDFLWPVLDDDGACKGVVAQNLHTMEMRTLAADAVIVATGGCGLIFGQSTMSVMCTGSAAARCYEAGAWLGNPEFIQVHPTAIPGEDKCRLMSESARGEGGRLWVPRRQDDNRKPREIPDDERWYFLEEKYPKYGNLVSRDIATREVFFVCRDGYGVGGGNMVYLDITHLPRDTKTKLKNILEIYETFTGDDPTQTPMKIFPAVHYSMGGLYTDYTPKADQHGLEYGAPQQMMTNIPGLYAFGEVNYQYHGGTRLGANALLSCIFDGLFCGQSVVNHVQGKLKLRAADAKQSLFEDALQRNQAEVQGLIDAQGDQNPYQIHKELGRTLNDNCTVVREQGPMEQSYEKLNELKERYKRIRLSDTGYWTNQTLSFARSLGGMLKYGEAILAASMERTESRGSHYRPDYPGRNDTDWLATTIAKYDAISDRPHLEFEPVPQPLVPPRERNYGATDEDEEDNPAETTKTEAQDPEHQNKSQSTTAPASAS